MLQLGIVNRLTQGGQAMGALRYPEYRKYWFATLASVTGFQTVMFSQLWLVRQLEENPIWLGAVGLAAGIPAILLNLVGGVIADKVDQRRLIVATQSITGSLILLLATLTLLDVVQVWHVLVIAFCTGSVQGFELPARQALFPRLLERPALMNAVALNSSIWQGTRIIAPAIAGTVIAAVGTEGALYLGSAGFLFTITLISRLKVPPSQKMARGSPLQDLLLGAKFVRDNSLFTSLITMTFFNSFFGMAYIQLMPIFTVDILHKGATAQGALVSASGIGALVGTIAVASLGRFTHRGWLILAASAAFGGFIIAFGLSSLYLLSLGLLFFVGLFQSIYMISIMSTLQMRVPDELRGRVMGIYGMAFNILPVGGMFGGLLASLVSAPFAVVVGGFAVAGYALFNGSSNRTVRGLQGDAGVGRLQPSRANPS